MNWSLFFEYTIYSFIGLVILLILFWKFYFLRDPSRNIPSGDNIISPADGKILEMFEYDLSKNDIGVINKGKFGKIKTYLGDVSNEGYVVSIFMSPMDVHINRSPIQGKILMQKHSKGKFNVAYNFWQSLENEKNEILIEGKFKIKMIQIAGFLARRIESFVNEGDLVVKGQRIGLINLGSQVTLILPKKLKPVVKIGQKVKSGETIIAKF